VFLQWLFFLAYLITIVQDRGWVGSAGPQKRESRESTLLSELAFVPFFDFAPTRRSKVQVTLDGESSRSSD
jgi:hypothetical protein